MIEPEMIGALKECKEITGLSEGGQIRQALKDWFRKQGLAVRKKMGRPRSVKPRKRS